MFAGMTEAEFDQLCTEVQKKFPDTEKKRLSRPDRVRDIGAGRPFALDLRNRVLLVLFYYRTYVSQDVAGAMFGIGQASVSRSISLTEPLLKQCLPIPEKIYKDSKRISSVEELAEIFPGMVCLTDASEQPTNRPKRKDMEESHYSGKAGTHTAKVQYTVNIHGAIVHKTPHSPGRVNDVKIYQMKHPTFWSGEEDGEELRHYMDRGYQGAQHIDAGTKVILPIKKSPGGKLTDDERVQQNTLKDTGVRGEWHTQGQDIQDNELQVQKQAQKVRSGQQYRVRAGQPEDTGTDSRCGLKNTAENNCNLPLVI